jgi:hypothetical protein
VVDSISFERRGLPVMAFAVDSLARTVGRAMMRAHGFPNFPLVEIPAPFFESVAPTDEEFEQKIVPAVDRGLKILFHGDPRALSAAAPEAEPLPTSAR